MRSSNVANGLVLNGAWQAYAIFLMLDIPFEVILAMPWLSHACLWLDWGTR